MIQILTIIPAGVSSLATEPDGIRVSRVRSSLTAATLFAIINVRHEVWLNSFLEMPRLRKQSISVDKDACTGEPGYAGYVDASRCNLSNTNKQI